MRLALAAALLLACRTPVPTTPAAEAPMAQSTFKPTLELDPMEATVAPGGTVSFHAATNYPEGIRYMRQPVKWEVMEKEGGSVTLSGLYTAPAQAGTFHVRVTRTDAEGQGLNRTATVTVK